MTDEVAGEIIEEPVETPDEPQERDWEAEATAQGWNPDYDGPNAKSAEQFVLDGEHISGIIKSKNRRLESEVAALKDQVSRMNAMSEQAVKRAREQERERLMSEQQKAVDRGDGAAFQKASDGLRQLDSQPVHEPAPSAAIVEFLKENDWYGTNDSLTRAADTIAGQMRYQGMHERMNEAEFLAEVARRTREELPNRFQNPNRQTAPKVGGGRPATKGGKGWNNLPAEAQEAGRRYISEGMFKDEAAYAKEYWSQT